MTHAGDHDYLVSAATTALAGESTDGDGSAQEVLAAGIFSWHDLLGAGALGAAAGGMVGAASDVGTATAIEAIGAAAGARAAEEAMAHQHGMTVPLLVAVTGDRIVVCNWLGDRAGERIASFDRDATEVEVQRFGLSRVVRLRDTASGEELGLHGSVARFSKQSGPDKAVIAELSADRS